MIPAPKRAKDIHQSLRAWIVDCKADLSQAIHGWKPDPKINSSSGLTDHSEHNQRLCMGIKPPWERPPIAGTYAIKRASKPLCRLGHSANQGIIAKMLIAVKHSTILFQGLSVGQPRLPQIISEGPRRVEETTYSNSRPSSVRVLKVVPGMFACCTTLNFLYPRLLRISISLRS